MLLVLCLLFVKCIFFKQVIFKLLLRRVRCSDVLLMHLLLHCARSILVTKSEIMIIHCEVCTKYTEMNIFKLQILLYKAVAPTAWLSEFLLVNRLTRSLFSGTPAWVEVPISWCLKWIIDLIGEINEYAELQLQQSAPLIFLLDEGSKHFN